MARTLAQVASVADVSRWYAAHLRGGAVVSVVMVRDTHTGPSPLRRSQRISGFSPHPPGERRVHRRVRRTDSIMALDHGTPCSVPLLGTIPLLGEPPVLPSLFLSKSTEILPPRRYRRKVSPRNSYARLRLEWLPLLAYEGIFTFQVIIVSEDSR